MRFCDEHCWRYNIQPPRTLSQEIIERSIYDRGYYDGRKDAYRENERERRLFRDMGDQEKFAKLLQEAMRPIEDLYKDLTK